MDQLTAEEKKEFREILSYFYGDQVYSWGINIKVLRLLEELLNKNESCNKYMDTVPGPFYFGNALKWAGKKGSKSNFEASERKRGIVTICA